MSSFTAPLFLQPSGDGARWMTHHAFSFEIGVKGSGLVITVPKGTVTDLATVPRFLWPIVPPHEPKLAAAFVLHDCLCRLDGFSRVVADAILYDALRVLGCSVIKASLAYWAVSLWRIIRRK